MAGLILRKFSGREGIKDIHFHIVSPMEPATLSRCGTPECYAMSTFMRTLMMVLAATYKYFYDVGLTGFNTKHFLK